MFNEDRWWRTVESPSLMIVNHFLSSRVTRRNSVWSSNCLSSGEASLIGDKKIAPKPPLLSFLLYPRDTRSNAYRVSTARRYSSKKYLLTLAYQFQGRRKEEGKDIAFSTV